MEVAVLLPLMMLLLMAVVQLGLWFHTRAVMTTAAQKAVEATRVDNGSTAEGEQAADEFLTHAQALRDADVEVERGPETASVSISGNVVSLMFGASIPISVTVDAPVERQVP